MIIIFVVTIILNFSKYEKNNKPPFVGVITNKQHVLSVFEISKNKTANMKKTVLNYGVKNGKVVKDIDAYLANVPPKERALLEKLRRTIKSAAPQAEEVISYQIPCFKYHGPLVFFAAFANHCSLYAIGKKLLAELANELKPFEVKGTTTHFTTANPLPPGLVKKIVKARIKENELRVKNK